MKLTVQIKVITTPDMYSSLLETMRVFNHACQWISDFAFDHKIFNKRNLQEKLYYQVKSRFCLPSQLIIRAFAKVGDAYRTARTNLRKRQIKYETLSAEKRARRKRPELRACTFQDTGATVYDSKLLIMARPIPFVFA